MAVSERAFDKTKKTWEPFHATRLLRRTQQFVSSTVTGTDPTATAELAQKRIVLRTDASNPDNNEP